MGIATPGLRLFPAHTICGFDHDAHVPVSTLDRLKWGPHTGVSVGSGASGPDVQLAA